MTSYTEYLRIINRILRVCHTPVSYRHLFKAVEDEYTGGWNTKALIQTCVDLGMLRVRDGKFYHEDYYRGLRRGMSLRETVRDLTNLYVSEKETDFYETHGIEKEFC